MTMSAAMENILLKRMAWHRWLVQVAVAGGYALCYVLFRSVSFSHWTPLMGFRLNCLLLVPRRYWLAMAIGEMFPLGYTSLNCLDKWGAVWAVFNLLPPIALAMPIVWAFRGGLSLIRSKRSLSMGSLLSCALVLSIVWTACFLLSVSLMRLPPHYQLPPINETAARYFLGNYLGVLTVTPLVLAILDLLRSKRANISQAPEESHRLLLDCICLLLPVLTFLIWIGMAGPLELHQVARIAMFLPVTWLALRHGWQGAAIAGAAASVSVVLTMPALHDVDTMEAEAFIAFAMTSMLLMGSHIGVLRDRERKDRLDSHVALQLAQQELYRGELRMHQAAMALEQVGDAMQATYGQLLERLRHVVSPSEEQFHHRQSQLTRQQIYRLADNLHPRALDKQGLSSAIRDGSIAQAMQSVSIDYDCRLVGRDPSELLPNVQMALYRLSCEIVAYLLAQDAIRHVALTLRCGETRGRRWAVLRVKGDRSDAQARLHQQEQELLRSRLGANGLALWNIRDQARLYGGDLHFRIAPQNFRVTMLLQDVIAA